MNGSISFILSLYLFVINVIALVIMKVDKHRAIKHQYRISEQTLWLFAIVGGSLGATLGMHLFRHKTKHTSFKLGFPFLVVIHIMLLILYFT